MHNRKDYINHHKTCELEECGQPFTSNKSHAKYCSDKCRWTAANKRKKGLIPSNAKKARLRKQGVLKSIRKLNKEDAKVFGKRKQLSQTNLEINRPVKLVQINKSKLAKLLVSSVAPNAELLIKKSPQTTCEVCGKNQLGESLILAPAMPSGHHGKRLMCRDCYKEYIELGLHVGVNVGVTKFH